jgi:two-component system, NtrC family, sensor kinase
LEQLKKIIQELNISEEEKAVIFAELKIIQKSIAVAEFKYSRTMVDKAAITNVLNASIKEIEEQKKIVEEAKNEIAKNMFELDKQKQVIEIKNRVLNETMTNLKETQSQLIQSEKMASLGELTAGIAHEIQNPLNFVNNFSDINTELIEEMKAAIDKGDLEEAKDLASDISSNEQKINFHGKRADGIVKGMLQHSRSSNNIKEQVNINVLADEYLRLAYHGLRAKDKSFNATMKTNYDENIGSITAVPQDIGRALLNLITNAFYAVNERRQQAQPDNHYEPTVIISTKKTDDKVEVKVKDNGNGILPKVLDKIFQPFFTTKPTGQGTGLGLSLCYDIIKAHGGELKVETQEGVGTTFIVLLPEKI